VVELNKTKIDEYKITAQSFNYPQVNNESIKGGTPKDNAAIILDVLKNKNSNGAFHTICANAAMALYAADYSNDLKECLKAAEESINSGAAYEKLIKLIEFGKNFTE